MMTIKWWDIALAVSWIPPFFCIFYWRDIREFFQRRKARKAKRAFERAFKDSIVSGYGYVAKEKEKFKRINPKRTIKDK